MASLGGHSPTNLSASTSSKNGNGELGLQDRASQSAVTDYLKGFISSAGKASRIEELNITNNRPASGLTQAAL